MDALDWQTISPPEVQGNDFSSKNIKIKIYNLKVNCRDVVRAIYES